MKIIYPKDNWILQKIGQILKRANFTSPIDLTYYINWKYWSQLGLIKSVYDVVLFTHFEKGDSTKILDAADLVICMSDHGQVELLDKHIDAAKIRVCPYWGVTSTIKKKIVIGTSGINTAAYRKNRLETIRLQQDLNPDVFEFKHSDTTDNKFWQSMDYFLQTSIIEGGSMDILNAIYSRVPIVSRDIGFTHSFKTGMDFIYKDYWELLAYFKNIEKAMLQKDAYAVNFTWDNFIQWHQELLAGLNV